MVGELHSRQFSITLEQFLHLLLCHTDPEGQMHLPFSRWNGKLHFEHLLGELQSRQLSIKSEQFLHLF